MAISVVASCGILCEIAFSRPLICRVYCLEFFNETADAHLKRAAIRKVTARIAFFRFRSSWDFNESAADYRSRATAPIPSKGGEVPTGGGSGLLSPLWRRLDRYSRGGKSARPLSGRIASVNMFHSEVGRNDPTRPLSPHTASVNSPTRK